MTDQGKRVSEKITTSQDRWASTSPRAVRASPRAQRGPQEKKKVGCTVPGIGWVCGKLGRGVGGTEGVKISARQGGGGGRRGHLAHEEATVCGSVNTCGDRLVRETMLGER